MPLRLRRLRPWVFVLVGVAFTAVILSHIARVDLDDPSDDFLYA